MKITTAGVGRLTRDPQRRLTETDKALMTLPIASGRREREADPVYLDVVCWDGPARTCAEHLRKGRLVAFSGRLQYREWQAQDGSRRSRHEVLADEVQFLDAPARAEES